MRNLEELNHFRNREWQKRIKSDVIQENLVGAFVIKLKTTGDYAYVLADNGVYNIGWEHLLISMPDRCLTWEEMCEINDLFFFENEATMQIHPAKANYVNIHNYCLHIWRPKDEKIPLPPVEYLF